MAKTKDSLFDEIVETRIAPDGTVEASLKPDAEQEMENAPSPTWSSGKDFKDANADRTQLLCGGTVVESLGASWRWLRTI